MHQIRFHLIIIRIQKSAFRYIASSRHHLGQLKVDLIKVLYTITTQIVYTSVNKVRGGHSLNMDE